MLNSKTWLVTLVVTCFSFSVLAAQTPEGIWAARSPVLGDEPIGKVKISLVRGNLIGELIEIFPLNSEVDHFCWRKQSNVTGPVVMCDYHEENGKWVGGKIYDSSSGNVYPSELKLSPDGNHLHVQGTKGILSDTAIWDRLNR